MTAPHLDDARAATVSLLTIVQQAEDVRARYELALADLHAANVRAALAEKTAADAVALAQLARTVATTAATTAQRQALARAADRILAPLTLPDVVASPAPSSPAARPSTQGGMPARLVPQPVAPQPGGALASVMS